MYEGRMYDVRKIKERIEPYKDVIVFMATLLIANYFWKYTMVGDENGEVVTWFGLDVTAPFEWMSCHIAAAVYWLVSLFRDTVYLVGSHAIRFESGSGSTIIWGCSGLKQMFIWCCLILTVLPVSKEPEAVRRLWLHKVWFIPFGWVCCHAFNVLRIFLITLFVEFHPEWFHLLHDYLFKYLFYGMMFGLWVWFVEGIRRPLPAATPSSETAQ